MTDDDLTKTHRSALVFTIPVVIDAADTRWIPTYLTQTGGLDDDPMGAHLFHNDSVPALVALVLRGQPEGTRWRMISPSQLFGIISDGEEE